MKFRKEALKEMDLPWSALEDRIIGVGRWCINHEIIFEFAGKFYQTTYRMAATEQQEERPWEYEDEIECQEVCQEPRVVMQWVPVNG